MSTSVGVSCTGTLKCFSSRAAADEAMGFITLTVVGSACGMAILWEQEGHWICVPAREASASSSCLQFGQTNITSIITSQLGLTGEKNKSLPRRILAKSLLIGSFELFDARINGRIGRRPLLNQSEQSTRFLGIC